MTFDLDEILDTLNLDAYLRHPGFLQLLRDYLTHIEAQATAARDEHASKAVGRVQDVSDDFLFAVFDQRHLLSRPEVKWYDPNTSLGDRSGRSRRTVKCGVCVHHTAVTGGFGVDKTLVRQYSKQEITYDPKLWLAHPRHRVREIALHGVRAPLTSGEWARAMALAHRYRGDPARKYNTGAPYHAISAANSMLYLNLPFDWVTWHGNGANTDFLGFAWDGNSTKEQAPAEDVQADLRYVIELARQEGHPIEELTVHAAWTNKPKDPGKVFIESVMVPVAEQTFCRINWNRKVDKRGARSMGEIVGLRAAHRDT